MQPGQSADSAIAIFNHSPETHRYRIRLHATRGLSVTPEELTITVPPRMEKQTRFTIRSRPNAQGVQLITADVAFGDIDLRRWTESLVEVAR
jgi:hypothetical protein